MRAERAVEPTRSENITVTWRRSAVSRGDEPAGARAAMEVTSAPFWASRLAIARSILRRRRRPRRAHLLVIRAPPTLSFLGDLLRFMGLERFSCLGLGAWVSSEPAVLAISSPNRAGQARGLQICSTISGDGRIAPIVRATSGSLTTASRSGGAPYQKAIVVNSRPSAANRSVSKARFRSVLIICLPPY
jgi:hypothetical protein